MSFRSLNYLDWAGTIAVVAFVVSVAIFLFFLVGALRTSRTRIDHDAALPFKEDKLS